MKLRAAVFALALAGAACSSVKTVPIFAGDTCFRCRRIITDTKVAAEVVDSGGRAFKFRTPGCLATYFKAHPEELATSKVFVTDYHSGRFIPAKNALFVPTTLFDGSDRTRDFKAFASASEARKTAEEALSRPTDWGGLLKSVAD